MRKLVNRIEFCLSQSKPNILKTVYFNFRTLPFRQAIKLPIFFYGKVRFFMLDGKAVFEDTELKRGMVKIGKNRDFFCGFKKSSFVYLGTGSQIVFHGPCSVSNDCVLRVEDNATLDLGQYSFVGGDVKIVCTQKIHIGDFTQIAYESQLIDSNFHYVLNDTHHTVSRLNGEIEIGDYNWIGNRCSIRKGTHTDNYSIVCENSILNKDYTSTEHTPVMIAGQPAKVLKKDAKRIFSLSLEHKLGDFFKSHPEVQEYHLTNNTEMDDLAETKQWFLQAF